jgi:hypothetical protein
VLLGRGPDSLVAKMIGDFLINREACLRAGDFVKHAAKFANPVHSFWNEVGDMSLVLRTSLITLVVAMASCDSDSRNPNLDSGGVTSCVGPEFSRYGDSGPGPERLVFKVTNQLVLAVPKENRPRASRIDREPRECRKFSDLPPAHFIQFLMQGNWSAGYKLSDIPTNRDGTKWFQPDRVFVRVEPEPVSPFSAEEQQKLAQTGWNLRHDVTEKKFEIAGLRCAVPKWKVRPVSYFCRARGTDADPDADPEVLSLRYFPEKAPPFVLIQADYRAPRYGKTHLYWQVWTSDVSHALEIDRAIWKLLSEWNLANETQAKSAR